jgi:hypothetical protein
MIAAFVLSVLPSSSGYIKAQETSVLHTTLHTTDDTHEVVYEETLQSKQRVVVLRREVPYVPPSKEEKAEIERKNAEIRNQFPDAQFVDVKPDRVSQYSMFLDSADGKSRSLL